MTWNRSRSKLALLGLLTLVLAAGWPLLSAQLNAQPNAQGDGAGEDTDRARAKVEALQQMEPAERRAELDRLSAEERRELWFELKRSQAIERGQEPATRRANSPYRNPEKRDAPRLEIDPPEQFVGAIVYDQNNPSTTFGGGAIIGNRFDTAQGNPILSSGTIATVTGVVVQGPAFNPMNDSAGFVIEGPQTVGGGAMAIFSTFTNGLTGTTTTVTFTGLGVNYPGSSFFVLFGDFASSYIPAFSTNSVDGQGFHGVVGYTGGMGPNITSTFDFGGTRNALVRVRGNVLPVELMSFEVE